jgi:hypothetical protein
MKNIIVDMNCEYIPIFFIFPEKLTKGKREERAVQLYET